MKLFYVLTPGSSHPYSIDAEDETDARRQVREMFDYKRLPRGTSVWEVNRRELDRIVKEKSRDPLSIQFL